MKEMEYIEVTANSDTNSGAGPIVGTGICFVNETDALKFICSERYAPYAIQGIIPQDDRNAKFYIREKKVKVYDDLDEYEALNPSEKDIISSIESKLDEAELAFFKSRLA